MKKFGAMLGDNVEVGCGSVLNPGTVDRPREQYLSAVFRQRRGSIPFYLQKTG